MKKQKGILNFSFWTNITKNQSPGSDNAITHIKHRL